MRNTTVAFLLGWKDIAGSSGFTLKRSRIYDVARAVQAEWSGSRDFFIADNVIIGRHEPTKMMSWSGALWANLPGFPELLQSEYGIKVYGQGHVVTHNYVANFHDAIDVSTYGEPDGTPDIAGTAVSGPSELDDHMASSIDFYRNDIYNMGDNCMEGDGGAHNIRVFENRCFNTAAATLSAQPIFGGPIYFYRNLVYNAPSGGPLKFADTPAGVYVYQNTFVAGDTSPGGPVANAHLRNNLFLGTGSERPVFQLDTTTNYSTSDYNGFGVNSGANNFAWNSPPDGTAADYDYTHKLTVRRFHTLKDYADATGQDRHSVTLDYKVFVNVPWPDRSDPQRLYNPGGYGLPSARAFPRHRCGHGACPPSMTALPERRPTWALMNSASPCRTMARANCRPVSARRRIWDIVPGTGRRGPIFTFFPNPCHDAAFHSRPHAHQAGRQCGRDLPRNAGAGAAAEALGYKRYWLVEHHNTRSVAGAATAVLMAHVAAHTKTIRVGAGGIMLPNHAPLMVAEQFGTLAALYPGRIDLGLGRGVPCDPATLQALRRTPNDAGEFPRDVQELLFFLKPAAPGQRCAPYPAKAPACRYGCWAQAWAAPSLPPAWDCPLPSPRISRRTSWIVALATYRGRFAPSAWLDKPQVMLSLTVVAADRMRRRGCCSPAPSRPVMRRCRRPSPIMKRRLIRNAWR